MTNSDRVSDGVMVTQSVPRVALGFLGQSPNGELVPTLTSTIQGLMAAGNNQWLYCSIPQSELAGLSGVSRLIRIRRGPSTPLADVLGQPLEIAHLVIHHASKVDHKTGEYSYFPRILLVGSDDRVYDCGSGSILSQLDELIAAGYGPPWHPPLRVRINQRTTTPPRRIYVLEVLTADSDMAEAARHSEPSPPVPPKSKRGG